MIAEARLRSELYAALAKAFAPPEAGLRCGELAAALVKGQRELGLGLPQEELAELREAVADLDEAGCARLSLEHTRLFEGPGQPVVYPYESLHRKEELARGEVAAQVQRCYAAAGLRLAPGFRDLPDHVVAELEFMAYLWARQAQAGEELRWEEAVGFLTQGRSFVTKHLGRWFPTFCHQILGGTTEPFYLALASLSRRLVRGEAVQAEDRPAIGDGWALGVDEGCTLCEACVRGCPTGALRLVPEEDTVGLVFQAAACDGCRRCLELCPMNLLRISSTSGAPASEGDRRLARSALARCSRCGEVLGAEATWSWVRQRLAGAPGASMVSLCFQCRSQELVRSSFR